MGNKTKKEINDFVKSIQNILDNTESKKISDLFYTVQTIYGKLDIRIDDEKSSVFSIFCRFEETDKLNDFNNNRVNKYSGKFNFHSFDIDSIVSDFKYEIELLTNKI